MLCSKYPDQTAAEISAVEFVDSLCQLFFLFVMLLKLAAYGDPRLYLSLRVNVFDCVVTSASIIAWAVEGQDESKGNHDMTVMRLCRIVRILSLARFFPQIYGLVTDAVQDASQMLSALFVIFFCWLIYALVGRQTFEGVALPPTAFPSGEQHFQAMGDFFYFDSMAGALFSVVMLMTGSNMSTSMVAVGQASGGSSLIVFLLVGGVVLELVLMKTFMAVLIDNSEMSDKDKVLLQLYEADKRKRGQEEELRRLLVVSATSGHHQCEFSEFAFSKKIDPVGFEPSTQTQGAVVQQGWAFYCLHGGDDAGRRVWLELLENGVIACWNVDITIRRGKSVWVRTHCDAHIPVRNAHVLPQSSARVRSVPQAGPWSCVIRCDCTDPNFLSIMRLHQEHVLCLPSRAALRAWLKTLALFGLLRPPARPLRPACVLLVMLASAAAAHGALPREGARAEAAAALKDAVG